MKITFEKIIIKLIISFVCIFTLYIIIIIFMYFNEKNIINYKTASSNLKLSELIEIQEDRIDYKEILYFKEDQIGFNALIDNKYFISVTKLGIYDNNLELNKLSSMPSVNKKLNFYTSNTDTSDINSRLIHTKKYPYVIHKLNYYINDSILTINKNTFLEIITECTELADIEEVEIAACGNLYFSFNDEILSDFGLVNFKKNNSFSFIKYNNELYFINLYNLENNGFKSLHQLIS